MLVTLVGNNSFALRHRLNKLVGDFVKEHGDLALERIDADEASFQTILDAVQNLPFLAERKMVVIREPSLNKQVSEQIEQIIDAANDSIDLIIYEPAPDKRTAYFKILKSKTQLEQFNELDAHQLANWLVEEAKERDGNLSLRDAGYLVDRVGINQILLSNELEKLITYDKNVTKESIDLLTEPTPQSKVFDLLDAAFSGHKEKALKLYEEQRIQKVEPQAILAMLAWQLQLLTLTKFAKKPANEIAKDTGMNPYPITKAANLSAKLSNDELKNMVDRAFEIDKKSKTSSIDVDEALKTYIVTL